ncbi:MAG: AI-2E family transporter [Dactylosporangium sp.]|nr:AI-2E family transporter [Dactylosporangium sp.]NNJ60194.1 AI-2E family transporter [Dactylosporangium sp.]
MAGAFGVIVVLVAASAVYTVRAVLVRVVIALFVAASLDPAVRWLTRRGMRRAIAVTIMFFLMVGTLAGFIWSVTPPLVAQGINLVEDIPGYVQELSRQSETYREFADRYGLTEKVVDYLSGLPAKIGSDAVGFAQRFLGALLNLLLIVVLTIYFLADLPRIRRGVVRLAPSDRRPRVAEIVNVVIDKVGGYMIGNLIISFFAGFSTFICLTLLDVPFALPLAFFVAITDLVPLVGATIGATGCVLVALLTVEPWPGATLVLLFFVAYQQVENYYIAPRVLRDTVDLSSTAVLVAALIGGSLLGMVGALMAIPVAAAAKVLMTPIVHALDTPPPPPPQPPEAQHPHPPESSWRQALSRLPRWRRSWPQRRGS